jgi:hypothetical protein
MRGMPIPHTAALITKCWAVAEEALRATVREKFPDRDEENITDLFHAELNVVFNEASARGTVAETFLKDLRHSFPTVANSDLSQISTGLIAMVNFHPREVEGRTGGDVGVVFVRPDVRNSQSWRTELLIEHEYKRGLLVQAKIFKRNSKWQALGSTQRRILKTKLSYLALLLYRYVDQNGPRRELEAFHWQLTRDATIEQVSMWLRSNDFPNLKSSDEILGALSNDRIGTDDRVVIETDIAPPKLRPSLEIKVRWKPGTPPPPGRIQVNDISTSAHQQQRIRIRS